ncbi:MAG: hypothetical protein CMJ20_05585 [Phycisphaeraceae bacterium]|nr:hypothetical protein [Phycisphaeraceae bacterium]|tara:strand:- start:83 stop:1687 length:1605 start_codon:yes stop_codon:yes gene_type:complete
MVVAVNMTAMKYEQAENPLAESFDPDQLITAWRNMANEQVMFPMDMSTIPVRIDHCRQLFVDNYLIADTEHVTRRTHEPQRHPDNPIVRSAEENIGNGIAIGFVLQFDEPPCFRMWYVSDPKHHLREDEGDLIRYMVCYATSDDGIHWDKPNLDMYTVPGTEQRNIVLPYGTLQGLFYEPEEPDAQKRFKALICVEARLPDRGPHTIPEGYYLHTSPDGIHWQGDLSRYKIAGLESTRRVRRGVVTYLDKKMIPYPNNGIGDSSIFWSDTIRGKYICDVKFLLPGKLRCRGIMESDDLIHWTRPVPTFFGREGQNQIYGHTGFAYQGIYIGMRYVYVVERTEHHSNNIELDCSRDAKVWTRVAAGEPFMGFNPRHDTWDASKVRPFSILEVGDEIWIYYGGKPTALETENPDLPKSHHSDNAIGLATLKRDRFVSIQARDQVGMLQTRPLTFRGTRLHVNADVADGGELKVAVVNRDGQVVPDYGAVQCDTVRGDGIDLPVTWNGGAGLDALQGRSVGLRFELRHADLFSFWID